MNPLFNEHYFEKSCIVYQRVLLQFTSKFGIFDLIIRIYYFPSLMYRLYIIVSRSYNLNSTRLAQVHFRVPLKT